MLGQMTIWENIISYHIYVYVCVCVYIYIYISHQEFLDKLNIIYLSTILYIYNIIYLSIYTYMCA